MISFFDVFSSLQCSYPTTGNMRNRNHFFWCQETTMVHSLYKNNMWSTTKMIWLTFTTQTACMCNSVNNSPKHLTHVHLCLTNTEQTSRNHAHDWNDNESRDAFISTQVFTRKFTISLILTYTNSLCIYN